jgi:ABC-2 type transport system ATP-binding protein
MIQGRGMIQKRGTTQKRGMVGGRGVIEARGLSKRFGDKLAVDQLSFIVDPGKVTGFLGPNGAGKSTTMRMILGLDHPTSGSVTVDGKPYRQLAHPMREMGALLDTRSVHGGRSAYNHLLCLAQTNGIPKRRVHEVLEVVGLSEMARKHSRGFSLGMGQRLGIAGALLGDPQILMFDEPVNGLDPEGIRWIRTLMKNLAAAGRTVFVSSHLMSEMQNTADHLIVIGRGRLIADCTVSEFIDRNSVQTVRVRSPQASYLAGLIAARGGRALVESGPDGADGIGADGGAAIIGAAGVGAAIIGAAGVGAAIIGAAGVGAAGVGPGGDVALLVQGMTPKVIGDLAFDNGVRVHELAPAQASLEEAFMELTADSVEYRAGDSGQRVPMGSGV